MQLGLAAVTEANNGDFTVRLKKDRKRDIDDIIADIRSEIENHRTRHQSRVHSAPPGHDRRLDQRPGARRHQTLFPGRQAPQ